MRSKVISMSEAHAARSLAPGDFLAEPCSNCGCGKGQHLLDNPDPRYRRYFRRGEGPCTKPGCGCEEYVATGALSYYGA